MRGKREAMPDPSSRRRRPPTPPPARGGGTGGGPLPTAALAIGVVVAGLGIGALVSAFQNRGNLPELGATSAPAVTPVAQVTPTPLGTLPPRPTPSPAPSAASPSAPPVTPSPAGTAAAATPAASAPPTHAPALPTPLETLAPRATSSPTPLATPAPATPAPHPPATPKPTPIALATARAAGPAAAPADPATALVRRYLQALIAGDESGAYAALGGTNGDRSLSLKEEAFLDKDARITSLRVSRSDASGVTIDADIVSGRGSYVATFHITNGPNGPAITQHDYIKV